MPNLSNRVPDMSSVVSALGNMNFGSLGNMFQSTIQPTIVPTAPTFIAAAATPQMIVAPHQVIAHPGAVHGVVQGIHHQAAHVPFHPNNNFGQGKKNKGKRYQPYGPKHFNSYDNNQHNNNNWNPNHHFNPNKQRNNNGYYNNNGNHNGYNDDYNNNGYNNNGGKNKNRKNGQNRSYSLDSHLNPSKLEATFATEMQTLVNAINQNTAQQAAQQAGVAGAGIPQIIEQHPPQVVVSQTPGF